MKNLRALPLLALSVAALSTSLVSKAGDGWVDLLVKIHGANNNASLEQTETIATIYARFAANAFQRFGVVPEFRAIDDGANSRFEFRDPKSGLVCFITWTDLLRRHWEIHF
jgi:hypothetical protein